MNSNFPIHIFSPRPNLQIAYTGPHLSFGPLPALFYFALSAQDSLCLDPFNQPAAYLSLLPMRVFSMTLPGHENNLPPTQALNVWAREIARGRNPIATFADQVQHAVEALLSEGVLIPEKMGIAGLSRGAFVAAQVAAKISQFRWILGFAPLIQPAYAKEFQEMVEQPLVQSLALEHLTSALFDRNLRFYIGNLDTRVSTKLCFDFVQKLALKAYENNIRSPQIELMISPSIGRDGHGTSKETFHQGAQWIAQKLGAIDVL